VQPADENPFIARMQENPRGFNMYRRYPLAKLFLAVAKKVTAKERLTEEGLKHLFVEHFLEFERF
jgi:hypothetical protein